MAYSPKGQGGDNEGEGAFSVGRGYDNAQYVARAPRFPSHALVEVRVSRWNPFSKSSAVLLDMSVTGFKIQFVEKVQMKQNAKITLSIPLEPFGISGNAKLNLNGELKWFDQQMMRAGGMFVQCSDHERLMIERIIASVINKQGS